MVSSFTELIDHPAFCLEIFRAQCWILVLYTVPKVMGCMEATGIVKKLRATGQKV